MASLIAVVFAILLAIAISFLTATLFFNSIRKLLVVTGPDKSERGSKNSNKDLFSIKYDFSGPFQEE